VYKFSPPGFWGFLRYFSKISDDKFSSGENFSITGIKPSPSPCLYTKFQEVNKNGKEY